ncbi:MAG: SUMF1/EgtB/PvdO family nonheme iron enzyme [Anaerolineae bacterium]|nr:SUMF1/EgtB/PvdO family nonheme iron enzyme [Anaerolineae bacterium]
MPAEQIFNLFVAIPDDLPAEDRSAVLDAIFDGDSYRGENGEVISFKAHSWDILPNVSDVKRHPDDTQVKSGRIKKPSECDAFIMVAWTKLEGKFPDESVEYPYRIHEVDKTYTCKYSSEWQFQDARAGKKGNKPYELYFYQCKRNFEPDRNRRKEQRAAEDFMDWVEDLDIELSYLHKTPYSKASELEELIRRHLAEVAMELSRWKVAEETRISDASIKVQPIDKDKNPFPGLAALSQESSDLFIGRDQEVNELASRFTKQDRHRALVFGKSGSGKSSLVGAGVLPRLKDEGWAIVPQFRPSDAGGPIKALVSSLLKEGSVKQKFGRIQTSNLDELVEEVEAKRSGVLERLVTTAFESSPKERLILYIDQFEELFTLYSDKIGKKDRQSFLDLLAQIANITSPKKQNKPDIIATVRADQVDEAMASSIGVLFKDDIVYIASPTSLELQEMMNGLVRKVGIRWEDETALPNKIMDDVKEQPNKMSSIGYMLQLLYEKCKDTGVFTLAAYNELGGVAQIFNERANKTLKEIAEHNNQTIDSLSTELYPLFDELAIITDEARLVKRGADLQALRQRGALTQELINALREIGLLTIIQKDDRHNVVEWAHENLFESWNLLEKWARQFRPAYMLKRQLDVMAEGWQDAIFSLIERKLESDEAKKALEDVFDSEDWFGVREKYVAEGLISRDELEEIDRQHYWQNERLQAALDAYRKLGQEIKEPVKSFARAEEEWLLEWIANPSTIHTERETYGTRLVKLEQLRQKMDGKRSPYYREGTGVADNGLPNLLWCGVDGGTINISAPEAGWSEPYQEQVNGFYITRYPVTYAQYKVFLDAEDGYQNRAWWEGLGAHEPNPGRQSPPNDASGLYIYRPADNVSWTDALAFCRWLRSRFEDGDEYEYRLPTLGEWLIAAKLQDTPARGFPWINGAWNNAYANTKESGLGHSISVGMYPFTDVFHTQGHVSDIIGNVYEWCMNEKSDFGVGQPTNYYHPEREDWRLIVGNCWECDLRKIQRKRFDFNPSKQREEFTGFRVVAAHKS